MKRVMFGIVLVMLMMIPVLSTAANNRNDAGDVVLTSEALMNMSSDERNAVFAGLRKQADLTKRQVVDGPTVKAFVDMDVETFKGKSIAVADAINVFCGKLGVSVNDFIKTPAGGMAVFAVVYKLGVFKSLWVFVKGILAIIIFTWLLIGLVTKRKETLHVHNSKGELTETEEILVPKFTPVDFADKGSQTIFSVLGSIVCVVAISIALCNM